MNWLSLAFWRIILTFMAQFFQSRLTKGKTFWIRIKRLRSRAYARKGNDMKKGFTLSETVVALAVILVIVLAFYSFANFSRAAHQRTMATNFGILQVENIKNIFDASTFQQNNFQNFQSNFAKIYDDVNINITPNSCDFINNLLS